MTLFAARPQPAGKYFKTLLFSILKSRICHHMQVSFTNDIHLFQSRHLGTKIVSDPVCYDQYCDEIRVLLSFQKVPVSLLSGLNE